jgi:TonB-dependent starch-binding outer membrane protein SusC
MKIDKVKSFVAFRYMGSSHRFKNYVRVMQLTCIFLTAFCVHLSAGVLSQTVTLSVKNESLQQVLNSIKKQTNYSFFAKSNLFKKSGRVTLDIKSATIAEALDACFKDQPFTYSIDGNIIVIEPVVENKKPVSVIPMFMDSPPVDIRGTIVNEKGEPVEGATVSIKGSKKATSSDKNGIFYLNGVDDNSILLVTGANIENYEVKIKGRFLFNITVQQKLSPLDQIQVIAYGTTTKRLSTGSVSTVKAVDIEKQPVTSPLLALQGKVPGLMIEQSSGIPGAGYKVEIRGQNHLQGFGKTSDPFYVIDGVPYISQLPGGSLNGGLIGGSPLNYINPLDIESISVLKDADATSIYGSRAANGAILITTKKGKNGPLGLDLSISHGFTKPKLGLEMMNTKQYLEMRKEAFANDNRTPGLADYDLNGTWDTSRYTDFVKLLKQNPAYFTNAQVSVSGGNVNTRYTVGANYSRQTTGFPSMLKGSGADQKASLHFNLISSSQDNRFKLSLTANYQSGKNTSQLNGNLSPVNPPVLPPLYNPDGSLNWAPKVPGQLGTFTNPLSYFYSSYNDISTNLIGGAVISYTLFKNLDIASTFGYTDLHSNQNTKEPVKGTDPGRRLTSGTALFQFSNSRSWNIEPQLNYHVQLGDGSLTALLGSSVQERNQESEIFRGSGFSNDALLGSIQAASNLSKTSFNAQYKYAAIFGRMGYNSNNKYLININFRRDGSSRFGPGKQFHTFASVSGCYIFTETRLFRDHFSFLSFGKLRGSYGTSGSDGFGDYQFLDLFTTIGGDGSTLPYQNGNGLYPESHFNPDLAWEESKKMDIALELGFLKDRISVEANYYRNRTGNQLVTSPLSGVTGYPTIPANLPALVQNSGIEFVINTVNIKRKEFQWTSSFNISTNRNKLVEFPNIEETSYKNLYVVGQSLNIIKGYNFQGVNTETGLYQFMGLDGNLTSSPSPITDKYVIFNLTPKYFGGFLNNLSYKDFELSFFLQFVNQKGKNINSSFSFPGGFANRSTNMLDRWQKPGDKAAYQKYFTVGSGPAYTAFDFANQSGWTYSTASFVRLKNISFSWYLPKTWQQKIKAKNFSVYIQGQNLLIITDYKGIDPETRGTNLPPVQTWVAGIRTSF